MCTYLRRLHGSRYNRETLDIKYKERHREVLAMTVEQAYDFFQNIRPLGTKLQTLLDVGLATSPWASPHHALGGESQRVKLSKELSRGDRATSISSIATHGPHFATPRSSSTCWQGLWTRATPGVIEHNLDVIKTRTDHRSGARGRRPGRRDRSGGIAR